MPFLEALLEVLPDDGILVADSTQPAYAAHNWWPARRPWDYISPAGFGTLGPALPMAIVAKIAAPDRVVACLAGDGGFLFTVAELATAADEKLALPILLWQNHGYGEIRDSMDRVNVPHVGVGSTARDFVKLAEGVLHPASEPTRTPEQPKPSASFTKSRAVEPTPTCGTLTRSMESRISP